LATQEDDDTKCEHRNGNSSQTDNFGGCIHKYYFSMNVFGGLFVEG